MSRTSFPTLLLLFSVTAAPSALAQASDLLHEHSLSTPGGLATPSDTIDGAKHPELIPDSTAFRLFFVVVGLAPGATTEETVRQGAHLAKLGLGESSAKSLVATLAKFKIEYNDLIKNYNDEAAVAMLQGQAPDYDALVRQRDALVQATRDGLKELLSADDLSALDQVVQHEKRQMKMVHAANK